ncbi:flagellar motor protein MotB [Thiomicrorhabdus sp. 6S2-11]|jgi:chemotaxis protein MotB|uniref:Flagellar motor protein MotB n=1 Tax=Thiomicrorhabdus marina TaxID=2818442 RepID=A0ABS3Q450_9GAMM|nr:flagellar motor protein MotB [Thiomicrorhabdus marina]MBO1927101.1 flagellar motor protein MotB [Thiomicrorhabdus marina]
MSDMDEGGAHGGSWKIALADLMTVLMVLFLVLWLISIVDPKDRQAFVNAMQGEPPIGAEVDDQQLFTPQVELIDLEMKPPVSRDEVEKALKDVNPKDVEIEETADYLKITLHSDSFFESGRATITDATREQLEVLGETLAGRDQAITITGYTDNIPISNLVYPSNWELSAGRAATVARTFIYMGLASSQITISGKADNNPVADNDTAYGRSLNRRVIIFVDKYPEETEKPVSEPQGNPFKAGRVQ